MEIDRPYSFSGQSVSGTCQAGQEVSIDYKVTGAKDYLKGGMIITQNAAFGDYFKVEVIDIDNVLGYGANLVLSTYINRWYIDPAAQYLAIEAPYAGHVPQNVYVRIIYTSTGGSNVGVAVNYSIHRID